MPDILVVCTANIARSPLFAARLALEADLRLGADRVEVASTGTDAVYGMPAASGSQVVATRWHRPLDDHHAIPISYHDLSKVGLILTMERAHRRAVSAQRPEVASRSFTVGELVAILDRRLSDADLDTLPPPDRVRDRITALSELAHRRRPRRLRRRYRDVPDPIGASQDVYDELGERFASDAQTIGETLFGPLRG